jgi:hypothetical protein
MSKIYGRYHEAVRRGEFDGVKRKTPSGSRVNDSKLHVKPIVLAFYRMA